MRKRSKYFIYIILIIYLISFQVVVANAKDIEDMHFKSADVSDVLRAIAEAADVNLVVDGTVKGTITIHLKDIDFNNALDYVTKAEGLTYKWDGSTVVVATPARIDSIFSSIITKTLQLKNVATDQLKQVLNSQYPGLSIHLSDDQEQMVIIGKEDEVNHASELINNIKEAFKKQDKVVQTVSISSGNTDNLISKVKEFYPELKITADQNGQQLIIAGNEENISNATRLIKTLDESTVNEKQILKYVDIKSNDLDGLITKAKQIYGDLKIVKNENNHQLVLFGLPETVTKAVSLISKLDVPQQKTENVYKLIDIKTNNMQDIIQKAKQIFPQLKFFPNGDNQLLVYGQPEVVADASDLIDKLAVPVNEEEKIVRTIKVNSENSTNIVEGLNKIYPGITVHKGKDNLIMYGPQPLVEKGISLVKSMDTSSQIDFTTNENKQEVSEIYQVDYLQPASITSLLKSNYPDLKFNEITERKQIIIKGKSVQVKEAIATAKKIDVPRRQVVIEARIEEVNRTELKQLGISPDKLSKINIINTNNSLDVNLTLPQVLQMLRENGTTKTLANPRLMTLNGEEAKLLIGDRVPVRVEKTENGETVATIEYIEAGVSLKFKPWITQDDHIILEVNPQVSSLGEVIAGGLPAVNTREAQTKISLKDGQTFIIGGLIQNDLMDTVSKVPLLSDIPILGEIFKHHSVDKKETELLIFVTPKIVKNDESEATLPSETSSGTSDTDNKKISQQQTENSGNSKDEIISDKKEEKYVDKEGYTKYQEEYKQYMSNRSIVK